MRAIPEAGVRSITPLLLHLRRGARECYLGMLEGEHPELMPGTGSSTAAGAYTRKRYQVEIAATVARLARRHGTGGGQPHRRGRATAAVKPHFGQPTLM